MDNDHTREPDVPSAVGGEHDPPGEISGVHTLFSAQAVADAFQVDIERVRRAFAGEFHFGPDAAVDSRQAQHLTDVILGDRPQAEQEAALMRLGAYTPRRDTIEPSVFEKPPGELSDRLRPSEEVPDIGAPEEPGQ